MKHTLIRILTSVLCMCLLLCLCAFGEGQIAFDGVVAAAGAGSVIAHIGGEASEIEFLAGQRIEIGDEIVTLLPENVTAEEAGVVRGIFGASGDSVDSLSARYGAVLYVEPDRVYTVSATTDNAYNLDENKFVHTGETVYLSCTDNSSMKGTGVITSVSGTSYEIEVTEGEFGIGDTVNVFRDESRASKTRIGRGTVARVNPTPYTGSGSVFNVYVTEGQHVEAGDVLFDTLSGVFDAYYSTGNVVKSDVSGIIESVNVTEGGAVNKGDVVLKVYPEGSMYIEFSVNETDLNYIGEGDSVEIEFLWNEGDVERIPGEITFISLISSDDNANYTARAAFKADETVRVGMTAVVYTVEAEEAFEETQAFAEEAPQENTEREKTEKERNDFRPQG